LTPLLNFIDLSIDTGFYSGGPEHWSQDLEDPEPASTFSGKLKYHCPYFFSTLSTLEKETLSSSKWLELSTSHVCPQSVDGVGGLPMSDQLTDTLHIPSCDLTEISRGPPQPLVVNQSESLTLHSDNCPSTLPVDPLVSDPTQGSSPILFVSSPTLPGYREPEDAEPSLEVVLDSYIPYLKDHSSLAQLPVFRGKAIQNTSSNVGEASGSRMVVGTKEKDFVWSHGLGFEISPIKT
jgi:hypothetical protein